MRLSPNGHLARMSVVVAILLAGASSALADCETWTQTETGSSEHAARQAAITAVNLRFNTWKVGQQTLDRYPSAADLNAAVERGRLDMDVKCRGDQCTAVKSWCRR